MHHICEFGHTKLFLGILNIPDKEAAPLSEVIRHLESIYCGHLSVELNHLSVGLFLYFFGDKGGIPHTFKSFLLAPFQ